MNPWLEHPQLWSGVHSALIVYIRDQLNPSLRPRYVAAIEERVFVEGPDRRIVPDVWIRKSGRSTPVSDIVDDGGVAVAVQVDVDDEPLVIEAPELEIHESYIEILDLHANKRLVTVIEVVSPTNKAPGPGRNSYLSKQAEILGSPVNLVEIDLLRAGQHVMAVPEVLARDRCDYDYLACVNRSAERRNRFELWPRKLPQRLPRLRIPLTDGDPDVRLDLQIEIQKLIDLGGYDDRIDYGQPCVPPLTAAGQAWANERIAATPDA